MSTDDPNSGWDPAVPANTAKSDEERTPAITERMRLVVLSGPDRGKEMALAQPRIVIGKSRICDLQLSDTEVSREHLELRLDADGVHARDLGSTNGTFFHGARFTHVTIGVGGRVQLGTTEIQIQHDPGYSTKLPSTREQFGALLGRSVPMREVFAALEQVAPAEAGVLIYGETGSGKELCAEAIHDESPRHNKPFVICDLAAMPRSLIESELFGHVRGSFTGADRDRVGAFAQAHGGTLFLDEIGELDLELQPRLLRAIELGQVKPIGANTYQKVDVRVLSATNRDLAEEVQAGRFRQDLLFRLSSVTIRLPPLRDRLDDIPFLVEKLLAESGVSASRQALAVLSGYDWPGNVRELRNVLDRAVAFASGSKVLTAAMVGFDGADGADDVPETEDEKFLIAKERLISRWERQYIAKLLEKVGGNVSAAARESGIARVYLYRLLKKYGFRGAG